MNQQPSPPPIPKVTTANITAETLLTPVSPVQFESLMSQFSIQQQQQQQQQQSTTPATNTSTTKLFSCSECHQVFNRAHNLKSHKATHSSASKPFQCSGCEKQFLRLHDLKRHQKLHTGERPYHCPVCKRSFSRLDALNRHRKTEGGSACLKKATSTLFMPTMTSQWQTGAVFGNKPDTTKPTLPPLVLPLENDALVDDLRQRIHDLEIENRVLRSLLCNNNKEVASSSASPSPSPSPPPPQLKKKLMIIQQEDEALKRIKRSP